PSRPRTYDNRGTVFEQRDALESVHGHARCADRRRIDRGRDELRRGKSFPDRARQEGRCGLGALAAIEPDIVIDVVVVVLLGGLLSVAELMSRYRDEPMRAIGNPPAILYLVINIAAAVAALGVARVFGWSFGVESGHPEQLRWTQVIVAGLGAMALFRSSLVNVRVAGQEVGV